MKNQKKAVTTVQDCIFCKIIAGQIPCEIITETNLSLVIQDIAPQAPIHYLIIPKQHIQDVASFSLQDTQLMVDMMLVPKKLVAQNPSAAAFKLLTHNGYAAGQRVFHLHFHFLAGNTLSE